MAIDQLGLYNDALLILGQRALSSLTEDREPRHLLDGAYTRDAVRYCLELVQPNFASKTAILSTPTSGVTFDNVHPLPADYVTVIEPFSDNKLDQAISRYVIEGKTLLSDYDTVYLRYISDGYLITDWAPSFFRVVGAYLARELCIRLSPDEQEVIQATFDKRVKEAQALEARKTPANRSSASTLTLTNVWRAIYNDALLIMGLEEITSNTDDSNRRVKLDTALNAGLVADLLEDTSWQFGQTTVEIQFNPSVEPPFGHQRAFDKPDDLHRLDGMYRDEYLNRPLKQYVDEGGRWFCEYDEIWVTYISTDFLVNPSGWPTYFKRLVAGRMAMDAAPSLRTEGADVDNAVLVHDKRESNATSNDAMQSPPHMLSTGSWVNSRYQGVGANRNRP